MAQQPQIGGDGESCYFVKIIDGKSTSTPLKRDTTYKNHDALYNDCNGLQKTGWCAAMAHNWGSPRVIGDVSHEVVFGLNLSGPWNKDDATYLSIYTPNGLKKENQDHGVSDLPNAQRLANAWAAFAETEDFKKLSEEEKEHRVFHFLAQEFPNGVVAETSDPVHPENRAYISCQTLY